MFNKIMNYPLAVSTKVLSAALIFSAQSASAQEKAGNVGDIADKLETQLGSVGKVIGAGAFVAGLAFVAMGLMRLKAAVDSQGQQVKYSEGVWRIVVGVGLVALPAVIGIGQGTFGLGADDKLDFTNGFN